jgi:hypothetical protein
LMHRHSARLAPWLLRGNFSRIRRFRRNSSVVRPTQRRRCAACRARQAHHRKGLCVGQPAGRRRREGFGVAGDKVRRRGAGPAGGMRGSMKWKRTR